MIQIDMNMPSNCQECRFFFDTLYDSKTYYYCHAMELPLFEEDVTGRPEDCPLEDVKDAKCEESPKVDSHAEYWDNIGSADLRGEDYEDNKDC